MLKSRGPRIEPWETPSDMFLSCADRDQTLELSQSDFAELEGMRGSTPSPPEDNTAVVHDILQPDIEETAVPPRQGNDEAAAAPRTSQPGTRNGLLGQTLAAELGARLQA